MDAFIERLMVACVIALLMSYLPGLVNDIA